MLLVTSYSKQQSVWLINQGNDGGDCRESETRCESGPLVVSSKGSPAGWLEGSAEAIPWRSQPVMMADSFSDLIVTASLLCKADRMLSQPFEWSYDACPRVRRFHPCCVDEQA